MTRVSKEEDPCAANEYIDPSLCWLEWFVRVPEGMSEEHFVDDIKNGALFIVFLLTDGTVTNENE